jgi:6-phosphogluconolactonase
MGNQNRREFLATTASATMAVAARPSFAAGSSQRVFVGSGTANGILAFDWDASTGELTSAGVAAKVSTVDWVTYSPNREYLFAAAELDRFNGKATGEVASFGVKGGSLSELSAENSAAAGTCHVAIDKTGRVLLSADYGGGSAASFLVKNGKLGELVWKEHYTDHGPNKSRQESAHAHFASFSPDNRFAYINDLGGDCIHIYKLNTTTAELTPAGKYQAKPGVGCRTLHFHPNGVTAYCMNEIVSTVDVLEWHKADGSLTLVNTIELMKPGYTGPTSTGCDTVITKSGKFVYFANRGDDFIASFKCDPQTGALTAMGRGPTGGKTPRNFVLDPTEKWMLIANQDSNNIAVFARNPETGVLAEKGKTFEAATPMCILF